MEKGLERINVMLATVKRWAWSDTETSAAVVASADDSGCSSVRSPGLTAAAAAAAGSDRAEPTQTLHSAAAAERHGR